MYVLTCSCCFVFLRFFVHSLNDWCIKCVHHYPWVLRKIKSILPCVWGYKYYMKFWSTSFSTMINPSGDIVYTRYIKCARLSGLRCWMFCLACLVCFDKSEVGREKASYNFNGRIAIQYTFQETFYSYEERYE